jgi:hypothetical protein
MSKLEMIWRDYKQLGFWRENSKTEVVVLQSA